MTTAVFILILTVCIFSVSVQSVSLADSQYPIYKANRERNNQINGSILCSDVAPGRTTVLNDTWASTDTRQADTAPPILGQNYFYILVSYSGSDYAIRRYVIAGNSPYAGEYPFRAMPTILQDGNLIVSGASDTVLLNEDLGELTPLLPNFDSRIGEQIIMPYQSSLLLRPDTSDGAGLISALDLTNNISNAYWTSNLTCPGTIRSVMVYSPLPGVDILVVVTDAGTWDTPKNITLCVDTSSYTIDGVNTNGWATPFIVEGVVYVTLSNGTIARFNIDSRTFGSAIIWDDLYYTQKSFMARGSKVLASLQSDAGDIIVELVSNTIVLADRSFAGNPTFSIPDNVVVFPTLDDEGNQQLMALDWDTWEVKATGLFDQLSVFTEMSEAVFDENCNVFVTTGNGIVHKFVPLPISDVVPMLDCVDEFNVAYFSYKNNEQSGLRIPYVADRNALTPGNIAPITLFTLDDAVHYPFSTRVQLQNASATYQWRLEDYLLTFSITPQLACPQNVSLTLTFIAMDKFNETSFTNVVINALVIVTGVRVERVSVVSVTTQNNVAKRMIRQGAPTLELELQIGAGNSSEPTSAEIVKDLVNNQSDDLATQVASDPDAPAQTQLNSIVPKAPVNAQRGELTPFVPPVASPNKSPTSGPSTQQQPSNNAPTSTPVQATSSGSKSFVLLRSVLCMLVAFVMWH